MFNRSIVVRKQTTLRRFLYTLLVISLTHLAWFSVQAGHKHLRLRVAVVVPSRSQSNWKSLAAASLHTLMLPSLVKTTRADFTHMAVEVIVVIDEGDTFWERRVNQHLLLMEHRDVHITIISVRSDEGHIPMNEGCIRAYESGVDYIVRVNDDTEFITDGWLSMGVTTLHGFKPPNLGVVGPTCEQGKTDILTHDMVHRTHLDIFDAYYPVVFDNWWVDDWISSVYGPQNTQRLEGWKVNHHMHTYGQRYIENRTQALLLPKALLDGKQRIFEYMIYGKNAGRRAWPIDHRRVKVLATSDESIPSPLP